MIAIIDYQAGNLTSVLRACNFLGIAAEITSDTGVIQQAERIIFPGVGHAGTAMRILRQRKLDIAIENAYNQGKPILGICLGSQIILSHSTEGDTQCLDLIKGQCFRFNFTDPTLKIPHMGWNSIHLEKKHELLKDLKEGDQVYFVHSYYTQPSDPTMIYASTHHGIDFAVAIGNRNLFATQFHPEKSGPIGLQILKNFSTWDGTSC